MIRELVISLIAGAASAGVIDGLLPESESSGAKYMRYLISLALTLTLLAPMRDFVSFDIPETIDFPLTSIEASAGVNSIGAMRIRTAVAAKFGYSEDELGAILEGRTLRLTLPRRFGVVESDLRDFVYSGWGVECEVSFTG